MADEHRGESTYLPAAGSDGALPLYDPALRLLGIERIKVDMLRPVLLASVRRVLDIGCGTGTLAVELGRSFPQLEITGLDPDPRALERARRKAVRAGLTMGLVQGFADALPFPDGSFDRVLSTLMFHHLDAGAKAAMLREAARVLAGGGELHLLDLELSERPRFPASLLRHHLAGNTEAGILAQLRASPLSAVQKRGSRRHWLGLIHIGHYQATACTASVGG